MKRRHENVFKKGLVAKLSPHMHIQSHEDKYSCGIPDVDGCYDQTSFWMELKIIDDYPERESTNLHGKLKHLTSEQCNWMLKRHKHGGKVFLFLKVIATKEYILFLGQDARKVKDSIEIELQDLQIARWEGTIPVNELLWELAT